MVPSDILNGKYPEHAGQLATILHSVDALVIWKQKGKERLERQRKKRIQAG